MARPLIIARDGILFNPYVIVPKNSDIRVRAIASTTNVEVDATFQALLAEVT